MVARCPLYRKYFLHIGRRVFYYIAATSVIVDTLPEMRCLGKRLRGSIGGRKRQFMKALVKKQAQPGLWLDDVPEPEIGINDVLIRVDRTGICGTDLHIYNWDAWAQKTIPVPMVVGHEFVGEVVAVGVQCQRLLPW